MFKRKPNYPEFDLALLKALTESMLSMQEAIKVMPLLEVAPEHRQAIAMAALYSAARKALPPKAPPEMIGILHAAAATVVTTHFGVKDGE